MKPIFTFPQPRRRLAEQSFHLKDRKTCPNKRSHRTPQPMQDVIRGLQALRGVAHISAVTIAAELGNISSRFESARKLMGYCGVFPSEDSSGKRIRRGGITKAGNAHLRR